MFERFIERKFVLRSVTAKSEKERIKFHVNRRQQIYHASFLRGGDEPEKLAAIDDFLAANFVNHSAVNVARFGGAVGVLAGILFIAHGLILILLQPHYWAASSFSDYLSIALTSSTLLALVGGLVGLHARQTGRCGKMERLEKISFFLAVLGAAVAAISNVAEDGLHIPLMGWVFIASISSLLLGLWLLAIATLGANVLPRWYGWALFVGLLGPLLNNHLLPDGGGFTPGLIWIVLGYALWRDQTRVPVPSERVHQEIHLHR